MIGHHFLNIRVADLKSGDGNWDEEFIQAMFNEDDAEMILIIPNLGWEIEDKILWHYIKNGKDDM
ncbi:hypothetical protein F8388_023466 [Cannabis sativa]|uniref:Uncharacterized protein n=1 Tax=Cannabis sativa TaxID=3483 RepID=A0A7J6FKS2_CANSA|nr:hypothetical protein F8388_023466 [Cannabis sativa]